MPPKRKATAGSRSVVKKKVRTEVVAGNTTQTEDKGEAHKSDAAQADKPSDPNSIITTYDPRWIAKVKLGVLRFQGAREYDRDRSSVGWFIRPAGPFHGPCNTCLGHGIKCESVTFFSGWHFPLPFRTANSDHSLVRTASDRFVQCWLVPQDGLEGAYYLTRDDILAAFAPHVQMKHDHDSRKAAASYVDLLTLPELARIVLDYLSPANYNALACNPPDPLPDAH